MLAVSAEQVPVAGNDQPVSTTVCQCREIGQDAMRRSVCVAVAGGCLLLGRVHRKGGKADLAVDHDIGRRDATGPAHDPVICGCGSFQRHRGSRSQLHAIAKPEDRCAPRSAARYESRFPAIVWTAAYSVGPFQVRPSSFLDESDVGADIPQGSPCCNSAGHVPTDQADHRPTWYPGGSMTAPARCLAGARADRVPRIFH